RLGVDLDDVARLGGREEQPAALADRVVDEAAVRAEHLAVAIEDWARADRVWRVPGDEAAVVVVGDEADLLALRLVGCHESELARPGAHLVLRHPAEGEERAAQELLRQGVEHVALVLARVEAAAEAPPATFRVAVAPHEVARRDGVGVEGVQPMENSLELDVLVAADAGVWRPSASVLVDEVLDHPLAEDVLEVQHVVRDADPVGDASSVLDRRERAAGVGSLDRLERGGSWLDVERDAYDLATLLDEHGRHDRRVDAAAHRGDDLGLHEGSVGKTPGRPGCLFLPETPHGSNGITPSGGGVPRAGRPCGAVPRAAPEGAGLHHAAWRSRPPAPRPGRARPRSRFGAPRRSRRPRRPSGGRGGAPQDARAQPRPSAEARRRCART